MLSPSQSAPPRARLIGIALVVAGAISYGMLAACVRIAYQRGFSPSQVVGAQMTFGCIALWALALALRAVRRIAPRAALGLLVAGIPTGLTGAFYYGAVHALESASLAIVLLFQFTWMGVLTSAALERRLPRRAELTSLVCLLVGTVLATGVLEVSLGVLAPVGIAFGLGSAMTYTAVIFASGRVATSVDPWLRSALLGTGAMLTVLVMYPPRFIFDGSLSRGLLGPGLLTALLGPVVPTICFAIGVPRVGASLASIIGAIELPAAMIAATLLLDEPTSLLRWVGVAVIFFGVALGRGHAGDHAPE